MRFRIESAAITLAFLAACTSCASSTPAPAAAGSDTQVTAAAAPAAPAAPNAAESKLRTALASPVRNDKERVRDVYRHPVETLTFMGLRDDATVVELFPGGGYYTSILAPVLAERGKLIVTYIADKDPKVETAQNNHDLFGRFDKNPEVFGKVGKQLIAPPSNVGLGAPGSADFVLTFRNIHNWIDDGYAETVFAEAFKVLKPGGVLGVEEHRGRPGMSIEAIKKTGYVPESVVQHLAEQAGFRLAARSEINANPKDDTNHPKGVWSLPPSLLGGDVDRDKYLAIGESDRMTLKFVKP